MTKRTYLVVPQKPTAAGWQPCAQHEARRFALQAQTSYTSRGKHYTTLRTLSAWQTLAQADEARTTAIATGAKKLAKPALGSRFPPSGRKIIARSLRKGVHYQ